MTYTRIARLRKEHGLTLIQAAERIGVGKSTLSAIERGASPSLATLLRIANAFDLTLEDVIKPVWGGRAA